MAKHTPGPWVIDALGVQARWNIDAVDGTAVAITNQLAGDRDWEQRDANTTLISAAPELLEVLRRLMADYDDFRERSGKTNKPMNKLMAEAKCILKRLENV